MAEDRHEYLDVVFSGPPDETARLLEVESPAGRSVAVGEWIEREDGTWALRIRPGDFDVRSNDLPAMNAALHPPRGVKNS